VALVARGRSEGYGGAVDGGGLPGNTVVFGYNTALLSALDTFTTLLNSRGGVLTAGAVFAGIVWKFFERIESVLTEQTKFEIAVWLVGANSATKLAPLEQLVKEDFYAVASRRRSRINRLLWVVVLSFQGVLITNLLFGPSSATLRTTGFGRENLLWLLCLWPSAICVNFVSSYDVEEFLKMSLLNYRLRRLGGTAVPLKAFVLTAMTASLLRAIAGLSLSCFLFLLVIRAMGEPDMVFMLYLYVIKPWLRPYALFVFWILLVPFALSGLLLRTASHFDLGFDWFNRKFDIEKKPLSAIGLVVGSAFAVVYWSFALSARLLR
jgi:hypothetical protein